MRNLWMGFGFLLALLALSSCIEFTRQTLSFHYDRRADRLLVFQNYEGIYGSEGAGGDLSKEEKVQLASVVDGQRTFFFGNWMSEYDRKKTEKLVKEMEAQTIPAEDAKKRQFLALAKMALANVTVHNGGFYLNQKNRLCAYQYVTVEHASKTVDALSKLIFLQFEKLIAADKGKDRRNFRKYQCSIG